MLPSSVREKEEPQYSFNEICFRGMQLLTLNGVSLEFVHFVDFTEGRLFVFIQVVWLFIGILSSILCCEIVIGRYLVFSFLKEKIKFKDFCIFFYGKI